MNLFALFGQILAAIKAGDYKAAACAAGRLITTVTCSTQDELRATALSAEPNAEPVTSSELYAACVEFSEDLRGVCDGAEDVCRMGAASNAELAPGQWLTLANAILEVLKLFVKRPAGWQPVPLATAPVSSGVVTPTLEESTGQPSLPTLAKPSEKAASQASATSGAGEKLNDDGGEDDEGEGDGTKTHDTSGDLIPPKKPKGKKS